MQTLPRWGVCDVMPIEISQTQHWIIILDENYRYVAISEPTRKYLWILSRTPEMPPAEYESYLQKLRAMKFDTSRLVKSP